MQTALIAFLGVIVGALLTEYFRVKNRIELFSSKVFDKRLATYEELYKKLTDSLDIAKDVIENPNYTKEERTEIWNTFVLSIASYNDEHSLYLNEDISVHCLALFFDVDEIHYIKNPEKKKKEIDQFYKSIRDAKEMIRKETGLHELDKYFRTIIKFKPTSEIIEYLNRRRKELEGKKKKNK